MTNARLLSQKDSELICCPFRDDGCTAGMSCMTGIDGADGSAPTTSSYKNQLYEILAERQSLANVELLNYILGKP